MPDARHPEGRVEPPPAGPLGGPDETTEPVHLPPVVPEPRRLGPSPADLTGEETVQLRLPQGSRPAGKDGRGGRGPTAR